MELSDRFYGFVGLCRRAGKLLCGEGRAVESLRHGRARVVLIASDASDNTVRRIRGMCDSRGVRLITVDDRYTFGAAAGMEYMVTAAVEDGGFAGRLTELTELTERKG